jgi:hypothetical protein
MGVIELLMVNIEATYNVCVSELGILRIPLFLVDGRGLIEII